MAVWFLVQSEPPESFCSAEQTQLWPRGPRCPLQGHQCSRGAFFIAMFSSNCPFSHLSPHVKLQPSWSPEHTQFSQFNTLWKIHQTKWWQGCTPGCWEGGHVFIWGVSAPWWHYNGMTQTTQHLIFKWLTIKQRKVKQPKDKIVFLSDWKPCWSVVQVFSCNHTHLVVS